jgi:hypothetical protein
MERGQADHTTVRMTGRVLGNVKGNDSIVLVALWGRKGRMQRPILQF